MSGKLPSPPFKSKLTVHVCVVFQIATSVISDVTGVLKLYDDV